MTAKVSYVMDTISKRVSIDYHDEEDLIEVFTDKAMEIACIKNRKICLVSCVYPEVFEKYNIKDLRRYSPEFRLVTIPNEHIKEVKDFYKALDIPFYSSY